MDEARLEAAFLHELMNAATALYEAGEAFPKLKRGCIVFFLACG
jgi:hypothetical protein